LMFVAQLYIINVPENVLGGALSAIYQRA
jgi:hypothetical protein